MLRALSETVLEGIPTTIPAHVAILSHDDVVSASHSTRWVEERLDLSALSSEAPAGGLAGPPGPSGTEGDGDAGAGRVLREVDAEVDGRRLPGAAVGPGRRRRRGRRYGWWWWR